MLRTIAVPLCLAALVAPACDDESRADRAEARAQAATEELGERVAGGNITPDEAAARITRLVDLAAEAKAARGEANPPDPEPEPSQAVPTPALPPPDAPPASPLEIARTSATVRADELERLYTDLASTLRRVVEAAPPDSQRVQRTIAEINTVQTEATRILGSLRRSIGSDELIAIISAGGRALRLAGPLRVQVEAARQPLRNIQPEL